MRDLLLSAAAGASALRIVFVSASLAALNGCAMAPDEATGSGGSASALSASGPAAGTIGGFLDGVAFNGSGVEYAGGWACAYATGQQLSVELFVAGESGLAPLVSLGRYTANAASEPAVSDACGDSGIDHRYTIPLTDVRQQYPGRRLYVKAVDPASELEVQLPSSGGAHVYPQHIYRPESYGAVPDGVSDSTAALQAALNDAIATGNSGTPAEVLLSSGTYAIHCATSQICLSIGGAQDVTVGGQGPGTTLAVTDPTNGVLWIHNSQNVHVVGFAVDAETPPFTQGTITSVSANSITLDIDPGMPGLGDEEYWINQGGSFGMIFSAITGQIRQDVPDFFPTYASGGSTLVDSSGQIGSYAHLGDKYVQLARGAGTYALYFSQSKDVGLDGVYVHAASSLTTAWVQNSGVISVNDLEINATGNRLISTDADGAHFQQNWGAPVITHCTFAGMADDAINVYSVGTPVVAVNAEPTSIVAVDSQYPIHAGDTIDILDPTQGVDRGSVPVAQVGSPFPSPSGTQTLVNLVFDASASGRGASIAYNTFGTFRGRGVLLKAPDTMIFDNQFTNITTAGVAMYPSLTGSFEGPMPRDETIVGNTFRGGSSIAATSSGEIVAADEGASYQNSPAAGVYNLSIAGNDFDYRSAIPDIRFGSVAQVYLESNSASGQPYAYSLVQNNTNSIVGYAGNVNALITDAPTAFVQVAAGADGDSWALDGDNNVYRYDFAAHHWHQMPGLLTQISVGSASAVWGVNGAGNVFHYDLASGSWDFLYSGATHVDAGPDGEAWVLTAAGEPTHFVDGAWVPAPGILTQLSVGVDGSVWGINAGQAVFRYDPAINGWNYMNGTLAQIAVGSAGSVWGVNAGGQIFRFDCAANDWKLMPGGLAQIAVGADGSVWGINAFQTAYRWSGLQWEQTSIGLGSVAVGNADAVWSIDSDGRTLLTW